MRFLTNWLDDRTGYRKLMREALYENIPGGSRWRYAWGSTLTFAIVVQFITGIFLMMLYSPSAQTAWASVNHIQNGMTGGDWLRGIHHFTAQVMTILLLLHLMQVVIDKAYKAPREINFWFGLFLLFVVLGLSLTGYLLPWDQKGFWATKVATNLMGVVPFIGSDLQRVVVGGADYGHHTLTRFFALHTVALPGLLIALIVGHIYLFRRHGIKAKQPYKRGDVPFWPDQVLKDAIACAAVLLAVLALVWITGGAELTAPANPAENYSAARPDWYFMFLFEVLKYFKGEKLIWGAIYLPTIACGVLFLLPFLGKWKIGHYLSVLLLWLGIFGFCVLTALAFYKDRKDPHFAEAVEQAHLEGERAKELVAISGVPAEGPLALLQNDPFIQGPKIFAKKCASCHSYDGHNGMGGKLADEPSAPDLKRFGSREWLSGFLDPGHIETDKYFGNTHFVNPEDGGRKSKMVRYVTEDMSQLTSAEDKQAIQALVAALSAQAQLSYQVDRDKADEDLITAGEDFIFEGHGDADACIDCHVYQDEEDGSAVDLTGWGSRQWIIDFINNPGHKRFYGKRNDRMPAFGDKGTLSEKQIQLVTDWLREDWLRKEVEKTSEPTPDP